MLTDSQFMQKQLKNVMTDYSISLKIAAVVKGLEAQIEMVKAGVGGLGSERHSKILQSH